MPTINAPAKSAVAAPTNQARAAWREEMLGQFLKQMKDHQLPQKTTAPTANHLEAVGKGRYLDVYI
ncbi:MAG: hypothetical protein LBT47_01435 [Deltaproteobacteria bacterium]|jgi:hypothetical protein|nr:hypothetical protein [Deltaproteobacteria bacterium]